MAGQLWTSKDAQRRRPARSLTRDMVPAGAGVYAWYRDGAAVYAGTAGGVDGLRGRVWKNHLATGNDLSRSSFRRNVCEFLGIAPTSVTTQRPPRLDAATVRPVNDWIRECEVAWIVCESARAAGDLEQALLAEWKPPLNRR